MFKWLKKETREETELLTEIPNINEAKRKTTEAHDRLSYVSEEELKEDLDLAIRNIHSGIEEGYKSTSIYIRDDESSKKLTVRVEHLIKELERAGYTAEESGTSGVTTRIHIGWY